MNIKKLIKKILLAFRPPRVYRYANFLGESIQIDYLFDDASTSLTKTDRCIRLRKQVSGKLHDFF